MSEFKCKIGQLDQYIGYYITRPVSDFSTGRLLININSQINKKIINKLQNFNIDAVQIGREKVEEASEEIEPEKTIAYKCKNNLAQTFIEVNKQLKHKLTFGKNKLVLSNKLIKDITNVITEILDIVSNNDMTSSLLVSLGERYSPLINHSIDVTLLTLCLCKNRKIETLLKDKEKGLPKFELPKSRIDYGNIVPLGVSALLHDIGKITILDIIKEDKKYSDKDEEREKIKEHPKEGYNLLFGKKVDRNSLLGIRFHHENFDGTGYPLGVDKYKIHVYGRIIRVVDSFCAATARRPGKGIIKKPIEVLKEIVELSEKHYDPEVVLPFLEMFKEKS